MGGRGFSHMTLSAVPTSSVVRTYVYTYVCVRHACGLRNSECHVCAELAVLYYRQSEIEKRFAPRIYIGRRRVELKVWRRTERGLQVEEEESMVFSIIEVRVKRAGPSGLGDLEVTEYIARIRNGPFEREDGAFVHLATTEARFMPD